MKKLSTASCIAVLACLVLAAGCQGKTGAKPGGSSTGGLAQALGGKARSATILSSKVTLYAEVEGEMTGKGAANLGDAVVWKDTVKEAVRAYDKAKRSFAKIEAEGKDQWVQDVFVAPDSVPGVIVGDEVVLYKKADITAPSGATIPKGTIVGVHSDKAEGGFISISAYIDGAKSPVVTRMFIKENFVTVVEADVKAMKLIVLAKAEKNAVVKKELLRNAESLGSSYGDIISSELEAMEPKVEPEPEPVEEAVEAVIDAVVEGGTP